MMNDVVSPSRMATHTNLLPEIYIFTGSYVGHFSLILRCCLSTVFLSVSICLKWCLMPLGVPFMDNINVSCILTLQLVTLEFVHWDIFLIFWFIKKNKSVRGFLLSYFGMRKRLKDKIDIWDHNMNFSSLCQWFTDLEDKSNVCTFGASLGCRLLCFFHSWKFYLAFGGNAFQIPEGCRIHSSCPDSLSKISRKSGTDLPWFKSHLMFRGHSTDFTCQSRLWVTGRTTQPVKIVI